MTKPPLDTETTAEYRKWLQRADHATRDAVSDRVSEYLAVGTVDDFTRRKNVKHLGKGLLEMKLRGIRVYFAIEQGMLVLLLGGTKNTPGEQDRDIERARRLLSQRRAAQSVRGGPHER